MNRSDIPNDVRTKDNFSGGTRIPNMHINAKPTIFNAGGSASASNPISLRLFKSSPTDPATQCE